MFSVHTDSNATWALGDGGSGAIWHGGTCPHFYKWLGWAQEDSVSRRTANKKLTKLYWPSRKCLPKRWKRLVVGLYVERKSGGHNEQHVPPLSNSFRCRWGGANALAYPDRGVRGFNFNPLPHWICLIFLVLLCFHKNTVRALLLNSFNPEFCTGKR